jgi:outer membrane protein assembly factor BamB
MRALLFAVVVSACHSSGGGGPPDSGHPDGGEVPDAGPSADVIQHHNSGTRDGLYVVPAFTKAAAQGLHLDTGFSAAVGGHVYAQPLYLKAAAATPDMLIVATESNEVSALDAATGAVVWRKTLGPPVPLSGLPCGNIDPLGITGTPVADPASRTVYLDAMTTGPRHLVFALSLDDGSTRAGWPVDISAAIAGFDSSVHNQRGALALLSGTLFVPYGGHFGDCGDYHGAIVAVPTAAPQTAFAWQTRAGGGAIWGPPGVSTDGASLYATTGNTFGATAWSDGEAVFRFPPSLVPADSFYPSNWKSLDDGDVDLGGSGAMLVHVPGATPADLAVALGKDGKIYLLDRAHLGGLGGQLFSATVSSSRIINAPAAWHSASGSWLAFHGPPAGNCSGDLTALRLSASAPPTASFAWCAHQNGAGSPIVTTTDGQAEALVWAVGSEGDNRLRAFDGETGAVVYAGGGAAEAMSFVRRFQSPIVAGGRIYVAGDGRVYTFTVR